MGIINIIRTIDQVSHKDTVKGTTTRKFKLDLLDYLLKNPPEGDFIEYGTHHGNTTVILAMIAAEFGRRLVTIDNNPTATASAKAFMSRMLGDTHHVRFVCCDAYHDSDPPGEFGFYFFDCVHTEEATMFDLERVWARHNPVIVLHDYGLVLPDGQSPHNVVDADSRFEIAAYLGEQSNWNPLGSGKADGPEGVVVRRRNHAA